MSGRKPFIMIVEDDKEMAELNSRVFERRGYDTVIARNAAQARELAGEFIPDLLVLDINLPDGDGISLCEELRKKTDAPILFLTGRKDIKDKIAGLDSGGDYYLTKPYSADELRAVAERLMRRAQEERKKTTEGLVITRGLLTLNTNERKAYVKGQDAGLTAKEYAVLLMLMQNEDKEVAAEEIYSKVWGMPSNDDTGALRQHISRLKKKLGEDETDDFSVLYKRGKGYVFTTK